MCARRDDDCDSGSRCNLVGAERLPVHRSQFVSRNPEASRDLGPRLEIVQTEWGIKPYRGLMGALKVRDEVEIVIEARLPAP